ncbi:GL19713 [Drosophila persimilis]|uniref:GL19713 n=1 Tax=Drosophila persimilis TaxID=7234 RepID=B4HB51_DROPE|nr:GL19713 [Drosophila persimilis]
MAGAGAGAAGSDVVYLVEDPWNAANQLPEIPCTRMRELDVLMNLGVNEALEHPICHCQALLRARIQNIEALALLEDAFKRTPQQPLAYAENSSILEDF